MVDKKNLTILWLDDMRDPYKYFNTKNISGAIIRNKEYYNNNIFNNFNTNFIWVKNFDEFVSFIKNNGVPKFVSFDHDLGKGLKKGLDCANWLIQYCKKTNTPMPKCFVHSANPNGQREIGKALNLNENTIKVKKTVLQRIIKESIIKHLSQI